MTTIASRPTGVRTPAELPERFMAAFNSGDFAAMDELFDPAAIRVLPGGRTLHGTQRTVPTRELYESAASLRIRLNECFVTRDVALLLTCSEIIRVDGTTSHGVAVDVARRDASGHWRYVIDNPQGVGLHCS